MEYRETLKIVVVGHVDHGKSTVIGRVLYDTKSVPEGKINRIIENCKEKGKPFEYAYLLDAFEEEQKQGITIDTTQIQFSTEKRDYVIIDAPGHKEFLKNMISGAANAEAALLIIDAYEGVQEQSRRHGYILSLLGIKKVYVVVNKMDLIDYSFKKFNQIKNELDEFLGILNVYPLEYIPVSAFYGENITKKPDNMPWFTGDNLLSSIDNIEKEKEIKDKPLRLPIQDVYKFDHRRIIAGRIESGELSVGDEVLISPYNKITRIKSIENWPDNNKLDRITSGKSVGITFEDEFFNKRGEFISKVDNPPKVSNLFKINLFWMGKCALVKGKRYKLKLVTEEVECEVISIDKVVDATSLDILTESQEVKTNDVAELTIKTKQKISFDLFRDNQNTGRVVLVDGYDVCGGGIICGEIKSDVNRLDLEYLNKHFANKSPEEIIEFVYDTFDLDKVTIASSLSNEDQILTSIAIKNNNKARVFFIDTGRHFQNTYDVLDLTALKYNFKYEIYSPDNKSIEKMVSEKGANLFYSSIENRKLCCKFRKLEPLKRALNGVDAWICGLRGHDSKFRWNVDIFEWDEQNQIYKINPLAKMNENEVWNYIKQKEIPYNSLYDKNFKSIGCQPCTRSIEKGEDVRDGRWWWEESEHKECGLHKEK